MRVCLVSMEWPPAGGGIGSYMFSLSRGLVRAGHKVTVITHDEEPAECEGVRFLRVPVPPKKAGILMRLQKWRMEPFDTWARQAFGAYKQLGEQFDVIETAEYGAWGRHFVAAAGVPVVVRCHNPTIAVWSANQTESKAYGKPLWVWFQDRLERRQVLCADAVISPSEALANYLSLGWIIPRSRFRVVPNPIDTQVFSPGQQAAGDREILYAGRLEYNKGVYDLAAAMAEVFERHDDVQLRIVGMDRPTPAMFSEKGRMASEAIRSMMSRHADRVHFTGHVPLPQLVEHYRRCYMTVMPTRGFESFSYTLCEAMSCGSAVIATRCGGPGEIVTDGVDGLLIEPGDAAGLSAAIERLLSEPNLRKKLADNARETIIRRFSNDAVIPQICRRYQEAIAGFDKRARGR